MVYLATRDVVSEENTVLHVCDVGHQGGDFASCLSRQLLDVILVTKIRSSVYGLLTVKSPAGVTSDVDR